MKINDWINGIASSKGYSMEQKPPRNALSQRFSSSTRTGVYPKGSYMWQRGIHGGLDVRGKTGTPVVALRRGKVITSKFDAGWGNTVVLRTEFGGTHRYAHLDSRAVVVGEQVPEGRVVGRLGNTGASTAEHLHFEVKDKAGILKDPIALYSESVPPTPTPMPEGQVFKDVPLDHPFFAVTKKAYELGLLKGIQKPDGLYYEGDRPMTRFEVAEVLINRLLAEKALTPEQP